MNIASLFVRCAEQTPGAAALVWDGGSTTYEELHHQARCAAAAFAKRGVVAGDRIALLLENDPAVAPALLGCLWLGAIASVLSSAWPSESAARAYGDCDARLLVTTRTSAIAIGEDPEHALLVDDGRRGSFWTLLAEQRDARVPVMDCATNDIATVLYSSGTTGDAKGVALTHGNLVFNALSKQRYCGITRGERLALVVPASHCFGQNVVVLGALTAGATIRLYRRFDAEQVRHDISRGHVSMLFAAPTAFRRLLDAGDAHALRPLRYALSAAAPLGEDLAREWEAQQMTPLYQGYGLTESSPFATYNHEDRIVLNTVGRPIAGVELRVGAIDSEEWLTPGEVGEVAIRGPNVMAGYWRRPDATARALRGGWLRTGDVGSLDEAGYLRLTDRLDDVVNVGGFKAYPSDVERVINAHAAVQESMAYTLPDAQLGARVGAFVVVRRGVMLDERELLRFLETRLSRYQRPVSISFTSELPRTSAGKLLRRGAATHVASTRHAAAARSTL